ncbi:hypothetical protein M8J76_008310 [Diaphorina citri]|nr:hypothetical protein M8J76_008310 [Diaphorina citri]
MELRPYLYTIWCFGISVVMAEQACPVQTKNSTTYKLHACLLQGYDATVRPQNKTISLWFELRYLSMNNDKIAMHGVLTAVSYIFLYPLIYDSDLYDGIVSVTLPSDSVWTPPMIVKKETTFLFQSSYTEVIESSNPATDVVYVNSLGALDLFDMVKLYGKCHDPDFSLYPFDQHNCSAYISLPDRSLDYTIEVYTFDPQFETYFHVIQEMTGTIQSTDEETYVEFNIVFRRHSSFLLFNFISLWIRHDNLMKLVLPVVSFFGSCYQITTIRKQMTQVYTNVDLFELVGEKPLYIVLLYRNIILLSLLVLLENFMASLLLMNRKLLVSVLMEYSPAFANARAPVTTGSIKDPEEGEDEEDEGEVPKAKLAAQLMSPPIRKQYISTPDYVLTVCDILIVSFIAYNFGFLMYLILHR